MSVNVQLSSELRRISGSSSVNLKQILNALGYVPANSESLYSHTSNSIIHVTEKEKNKWNGAFSGKWEDLLNKPAISSDNNDKIVFVDSNSNIIAQIDKDGFKTTEVYIRGVNIRDLMSGKKGFSGYYNDLVGAPAIFDNSSEELVFCDPQGYIIGKINYNGLTTSALFIKDRKNEIKNILDILEETGGQGDIEIDYETYLAFDVTEIVG